ncbi:MAG: glutamyl-tRNA reductase, partial [Clostridia bacterium]|nr:glutamyl-tRNA reductase [Deltaproteobacteria bacterium]
MRSVRPSMLDGFALLGVSHRTAPFDDLERLALSKEETAALYEELVNGGMVRSAFVLSTCNRTEIYAQAEASSADLIESVARSLSRVVGSKRFPKGDVFYRHSGQNGAEHLFRVACGLDSMILGEQQILGQLKNAYLDATERLNQTVAFDKLVQSALRVGARSRMTTEIGRGAVSTASAAVHLATRIYGDLSRCCVLVVGAGETGRLLAQHFAAHYPQRLIILNRTLEKAQVLAREVSGEADTLDRLPQLLAQAHVVATAVRSPAPLITHRMLSAVEDARSGQALAIVDLGLPRNVEVGANGIDNVFVNDLQSLQSMVDGNLARRKRAVPKTEKLIRDELAKIETWEASLSAGPLIAMLREAVETVRTAEVQRSTRGMTDAQREAVDRATRAVVNKLMHGPM